MSNEIDQIQNLALLEQYGKELHRFSDVYLMPDALETAFQCLGDSERAQQVLDRLHAVMGRGGGVLCLSRPRRGRGGWEPEILPSRNGSAEETVRERLKTQLPQRPAIVVSQSRAFLSELRQSLGAGNTPYPDTLWTLSCNREAELYNPFDQEHGSLMEYMAAEKLHNVIRAGTVYVDATALAGEGAKLFLRHVKAPLLKHGGQLAVLAFKSRELPQADLLIQRVQEKPQTVRFVYKNEELPEVNAAAAAILEDCRRNGASRVCLMYGHMRKGLNVANILESAGIKADFYRINSHGFLSRGVALAENLAKSYTLSAENNAQELLDAIERGDNERAIHMASSKIRSKDLEMGIVAAVKCGNDTMLAHLIHQIDTCTGQALHWWVQDFPEFAQHQYLPTHPQHFALLQELISKVRNKPLLVSVHAQMEDVRKVMKDGNAYLDKLIEQVRQVVSPKLKQAEPEAPAAAGLRELLRTLLNVVSADTFSSETAMEILVCFMLLRRAHDTRSADLRGDARPMLERGAEALRAGQAEFEGALSPRLAFICRNLQLADKLDKLMPYENVRKALDDVLVSPLWAMGADELPEQDFQAAVLDLISRVTGSRMHAETVGAESVGDLLAELLVTPHTGRALEIFDPVAGCGMYLGALCRNYGNLFPAGTCRAFGQDINPQALAFASIRFMFAGMENVELACADSLQEDAFPTQKYDCIVAEPPFAIKVRATLPGLGLDGQVPTDELAFLHLALSKLKDTGKMAFVMVGKALSARAGSDFRKHLLEKDLLEAVIRLPRRLYRATAIAPYIWIVNKAKPAERAGKVLLIDAANCCANAPKRGGELRSIVNEDNRRLILQAYTEFTDNATYGDPTDVHCRSRVLDPADFLFHEEGTDGPKDRIDCRIPFSKYFMDFHGEPLETALPKLIASLHDRIKSLIEERDKRVAHFNERIEECSERIAEYEIAAREAGIPVYPDPPKHSR